MGRRKGGDEPASGAGAAGAPVPVSLGLWIARARSVGALIGFGVAFLVCRRAGLPLADAALRGLAGALALWLVAWWCALTVVTALVRTAAEQRRERMAEAQMARQAPGIAGE